MKPVKHFQVIIYRHFKNEFSLVECLKTVWWLLLQMKNKNKKAGKKNPKQHKEVFQHKWSFRMIGSKYNCLYVFYTSNLFIYI